MTADTIVVDTADGPMELFDVHPDEPTGAAVIVVQEAFGVNEHIRDVTRRFAAAGYRAVAPALFHRAGGGTAPYGDLDKVKPLYEGLDDEAILVDIDATLGHLRNEGHSDERVGIVGFCMGGRATFLTAISRRLGAAVGFYGGGIVTPRGPRFPALVDRAAELQTPWLGLFGDLDGSIPVEDVETLRKALADVDTESQIVRYSAAGHGFHCDERDSYHPEAAADAWQRTLDFLAEHL